MIIVNLVKKEHSYKELNVLQNAQMDYMEMLFLNNAKLAQVLVILVMDQMMEIAYHAKLEDIYIIHNVYSNVQKNSLEIHKLMYATNVSLIVLLAKDHQQKIAYLVSKENS